MTLPRNQFLIGDVLDRLRELPEGCVHTCICSPPYWGLRSYLPTDDVGKSYEIGLEKTPDEYVARLVEVFREVRRVLRDDGTLWINIGSSYASGGMSASRSLQYSRAPACGSGGTELQYFPDVGRVCLDFCDGRLDVIPSRHGHSVHSVRFGQPIERPILQTDRDSVHADCVQEPTGGVLHGVLQSTTDESSPLLRQAAFYHGALASVSLAAWQTSQPGVQPFVHNSVCNGGISQTTQPLVGHNLGTESFVSACKRLDCRGVGRCGFCWCSLAIPSLQVKSGDLCDTPHLLAFALQADGWLLRTDTIWAKGQSFNPVGYSGSCMPESVNGWRWERCRVKVKEGEYLGRRDPARGEIASSAHHPAMAVWEDCPGCPKCSSNNGYVLRKGSWRPTRAHEYVFMLAKSQGYYCNAEAVKEAAIKGAAGSRFDCGKTAVHQMNRSQSGVRGSDNSATRNPRDVWAVQTEPVKFKHYATFPRALVRPIILAATPEHCCSSCGAPHAPVVETSYENPGNRTTNGPRSLERRYETAGFTVRLEKRTSVERYRSTCVCNAPPARCVVLDPFMGSGTTAIVAEELGRDWIGIDLDERNLEIYKARRQQLLIKGELTNKETDSMEDNGTANETAERRYVTRLRSNLKWPMDLSLGRKVLLVGRNGTGKSSVVDAFSLVTTGEARSEGLGKGREVVASGSCDRQKVFVEATISDGEIVTWPDGEVGGGNVYTSVWRALYGDSKTLQAVVLRAATSADGRPWQSVIRSQSERFVPGAYQDDMNALIEQAASAQNRAWSGGVAEALEWMVDKCAGEIRAATRAVTTIESVRVEPLAEVERAELEQLEALSRVAPDLDARTRAAERAQRGTGLKGEIIDLARELESLGAQQSQGLYGAGDLAGQQSVLERVEGAIGAILGRISEQSSSASIKCPCCGSETVVGALRARSLQLADVLRAISERLSGTREIENAIRAKRSILETRQQELDLIYRQIKALLPYREIDVSPAELRSRMTLLRDRAQAGQANAAIQRSTVDVEQRKQVTQALHQALQRVRSEFASSVLTMAASRVNYLLPPRIRVSVESTGKLGQGCAIKAAVDGKPAAPFRLLGGAERATVAMALASAVSGRGQTGGPETLVVDDVWLDRRSTTALIALVDDSMRSETGPDQVVLSVVEYDGNVPDDWTVIDLGTVGSERPVTVGAATEVATGVTTTPTGGSASGPEQIGEVDQPGRGMVPVYWLGSVSRFTGSMQNKLAEIPDKVEGMYGVAMSGKNRDVLKAVVWLNRMVYPASLTPTLSGALGRLVSGKLARGERGEQGEQSADDSPAQEE